MTFSFVQLPAGWKRGGHGTDLFTVMSDMGRMQNEMCAAKTKTLTLNLTQVCSGFQ